MARVDIKKCKFKGCSHADNSIDLVADEYIQIGKQFYHKDCYERKSEEERNAKSVSADLQLIRHLWIEYINPTVVFSLLNKVLKDCLDRGTSSDYLVFVMRYVIDHHCKLNHPPGLRYYVDKAEIKAAYKKSKAESVSHTKFHIVEAHDAQAQKKFSTPRTNNGFGSIIGGKA